MRTLFIALVVIVAAAVGFWLWPSSETPRIADNPPSGSTAAPSTLKLPADEAEPIQNSDQINAAPIQSDTAAESAEVDAIMAKRIREEEYQRAAEARFAEAVQMDGLRPEDVNPAVRDLFASVRLKPVVRPDQDQPGFVDGMELATVMPQSPLAQAGFQTGDRLTRINGEALTDPAQIAQLMTRMENYVEICAERNQQTLCKALTL